MYNPYGDQGLSSNVYSNNNQANSRVAHPQGIANNINNNSNQYQQNIYGLRNQQQQQQQQPPQQQQQQQQPPRENVGLQGTPQAFNNFFNDPKANLGFQVGQTAFAQGTQMMENNLKPYIGSSSDLKNLFKVSNKYVLKKISLILFPFRHSSWSRLILNNSGSSMNNGNRSVESFELPVNDINSPDLYIPLMSFITYILLCAIFQGLKGEFHPQLFGYTSSIVFGYQLLDILVLKLGLYLLNVESNFWDLISYSNYKFIPLVISLIVDFFTKSATGGNTINYWLIFGYLDFAFAFFLMRSLKQVFLGNGINNSTQTVTHKQRQKRIYLLFGYSFPFQMILMFLLM
ncbi:protein transporter [Saccharomycopsis crataegensis]|uniref:Protein YIF1 n=1 Tax=Saccharomycopsis crataegensis TaxID=43959 RepID=A0AAV5QTV0_9ASCO|nr:protein transporter [Saccharomycopsis crataegensis]